MGLFKSIFTWWDGPTWGTRLWTSLNGESVGSDEQGNAYYRKGGGKGRAERRWVIFNGANEASRVPAEWHGWLHKTTDVLPADQTTPRRSWQKPHAPNLTGTGRAWVRPGALGAPVPRARATGDYEAWTPDQQ